MTGADSNALAEIGSLLAEEPDGMTERELYDFTPAETAEIAAALARGVDMGTLTREEAMGQPVRYRLVARPLETPGDTTQEEDTDDA